jgi:hypothetical protein
MQNSYSLALKLRYVDRVPRTERNTEQEPGDEEHDPDEKNVAQTCSNVPPDGFNKQFHARSIDELHFGMDQ